jgi:hypothetical protein
MTIDLRDFPTSAGAEVLPDCAADSLGHADPFLGGTQQQVTLELRAQPHGLDRGRRRSQGRATTSATSTDLLDVITALGLIGHRLDQLIGDRGAIGCGSVGPRHFHHPSGSRSRYWAVIGIAWMTAGPWGPIQHDQLK